MRLRLATEQEAQHVIGVARDWSTKRHGRVMFENASTVANSAVAEFLANKQGLTLYESKVGLELPENES